MPALATPAASLHAHDVDGEFVVRRDDYRPGDHSVLPPAFQQLALQKQQGPVRGVGNHQGSDVGGGLLADARGRGRGAVVAHSISTSPHTGNTPSAPWVVPLPERELSAR